MRHAVCALLLLMASGCDRNAIEDLPVMSTSPAGEANLWGADAYLAPSTPDALLRYGDYQRAFAELRLPEGDGPFPLAVIFHGGCWTTGLATQAIMGPLATRWQQLGIASLNVDYREVGDGGGWPGSFEDWQAAGELVRRVVRDRRIDRSRVTLVGHSAGGLPALWLAIAQDADGPVGARQPLPVRAAIVLDGQGDVAQEQPAFDALCQFSAVDPFMGGTPDQVAARYAAISPLRHAPKLDQLLFVQAVLPPAPAAVQQAFRSAGTKLEVRSNPGASHFAIITPGDPVYGANEPAILEVLKGQ